MADFLLELRSEEIPARMQPAAIEQLVRRFGEGLVAARLAVGRVDGFAGPRRLTLIAHGIGDTGAAAADERRGPRADAPEAAVAGFLKSTGLTRDQLEERDTPKGRFLYATIVSEGRPAAAILAELVPQIVREFDWPKSMRWGAASASTASQRWVRPLSGIVALLGEAVVPFEVAGLTSGRTTRGHRFMAGGEVEIEAPATYAAQLRAAFVMVDAAERRAVIAAGAEAAAAAAGLALISDAGLVAENAGLTEWSVPLLGRFDPAYLDVPREVIQLTMRTNQKYFACTDARGALAPAFVCVANLVAADGGAGIVAGNRKVLAARLADAKFFWDQDRATTLEARLPKLADIVFHEKLGTVADKVERVAKLARWLAESGAVPGADPALAEQAARLCKADLVSATVGEFPEVQGIAGGYLAAAEGLDPQVAAAIRDHYKPVGPSDEVPTAPVTVAVTLADKLDTLIGFFATGEKPTGSRDPYALRRAMLSIIRLIRRNLLFLPLDQVAIDHRLTIAESIAGRFWLIDNSEYGNVMPPPLIGVQGDWENELKCWPYGAAKYQAADEFVPREDYEEERNPPFIFRRQVDVRKDLAEFLLDRLRVQLRERGLRHDVISAVLPRTWSSMAFRPAWLYAAVLEESAPASSAVMYQPSDQVIWLEEAVEKLEEVLSTAAGESALYVYRRIASILTDAMVATDFESKSEIGAPSAAVDLSSWQARLEVELLAACASRDFSKAIAAIGNGRAVVDRFFDDVTVNDSDARKRASRLGLLSRLRRTMLTVADFSKIEG